MGLNGRAAPRHRVTDTIKEDSVAVVRATCPGHHSQHSPEPGVRVPGQRDRHPDPRRRGPPDLRSEGEPDDRRGRHGAVFAVRGGHTTRLRGFQPELSPTRSACQQPTRCAAGVSTPAKAAPSIELEERVILLLPGCAASFAAHPRPGTPTPWCRDDPARAARGLGPPRDGGTFIDPSRIADAAFTLGCEVGGATRQQDRGTAPVARPQYSREHTMTRFIQENWIAVIFVVAMLAMHLGHRGGHGGGQHGGAGGCGGGHAGHQDPSSAGEPRSQSHSRTDGNPTPQDATPQDSARPHNAKSAHPLPVHHHH